MNALVESRRSDPLGLHRQRRLQHGERADHVRGVKGELQDDIPARGMANQMRPVNSQVAHERAEVGRLLGDADRSRRAATARIADAMVGHQAVTAGEGRLVQKGLVPAGEDSGVHKHHWLPAPSNLVFELDAIETGPTHGPRPFSGGRKLRYGDGQKHRENGERCNAFHGWSSLLPVVRGGRQRVVNRAVKNHVSTALARLASDARVDPLAQEWYR